MAQLAKGIMAFGIFVSHGLACYVAFDITWNGYVKKRLGVDRKKIVWELVVRTILVLATCELYLASIGPLEIEFNVFFSLFRCSSLGRCNTKSGAIHFPFRCILLVDSGIGISRISRVLHLC